MGCPKSRIVIAAETTSAVHAITKRGAPEFNVQCLNFGSTILFFPGAPLFPVSGKGGSLLQEGAEDPTQVLSARVRVAPPVQWAGPGDKK